MAGAIGEVTVAFVPIERMYQDLISLSLNTGQACIDHWAIIVRRGGSFPLRGKPEAGTGEVFVRAHHCAPKIAFEIQSRGMLLRCGKVTVQHIEIEETVVVEVGKASAP